MRCADNFVLSVLTTIASMQLWPISLGARVWARHRDKREDAWAKGSRHARTVWCGAPMAFAISKVLRPSAARNMISRYVLQ